MGAELMLQQLLFLTILLCNLALQAVGDDQGIRFHDVRNIAGYVPQVRSPMFSYPLIVCPTKGLGDALFDW
jgi:hypothetical protein